MSSWPDSPSSSAPVHLGQTGGPAGGDQPASIQLDWVAGQLPPGATAKSFVEDYLLRVPRRRVCHHLPVSRDVDHGGGSSADTPRLVAATRTCPTSSPSVREKADHQVDRRTPRRWARTSSVASTDRLGSVTTHGRGPPVRPWLSAGHGRTRLRRPPVPLQQWQQRRIPGRGAELQPQRVHLHPKGACQLGQRRRVGGARPQGDTRRVPAPAERPRSS